MAGGGLQGLGLADEVGRGPFWRGGQRHGLAVLAWRGLLGQTTIRLAKTTKGVKNINKYEWKQPRYKGINAQDAGQLLEGIHQRYGGIKPKVVVDESRPQKALLHECFEWQDDIAGELYREEQARTVIRNLVIIPTQQKARKIRAFVHIKETQSQYMPLSIVVSAENLRQQMLASALKELQAFQQKYQSLHELSALFMHIEKLGQEVSA